MLSHMLRFDRTCKQLRNCMYRCTSSLNEPHFQIGCAQKLQATHEACKVLKQTKIGIQDSNVQSLQVDLAKAAYQRALLKMPRLYCLLNPANSEFIRTKASHGGAMAGDIPIFTSEEKLVEYWTSNPDYWRDFMMCSETILHSAVRAALPGSSVISALVSDSHPFVVDCDPEDGSNVGRVIPGDDFKLDCLAQDWELCAGPACDDDKVDANTRAALSSMM